MSTARLIILTAVAMLAFAANSILNRVALTDSTIHPATFTLIRLASGSVLLLLLVGYARWRRADSAPQAPGQVRHWPALCLFLYAAGFSLAYRDLSAASGALLLFGSVQLTMVGYAIFSGQRLHGLQWLGLAAAIAGIAYLLLPGAAAPELQPALLMMMAGIAWGAYSLLGRGSADPVADTAANLLLATPLSAGLQGAALLDRASWPLHGVLYACASGALASGAGYALWYSVLPQMKATTAATLQLSVPVLTALMGVLFLAEAPGERLWLASLLVLGGIFLYLRNPQRTA
jgi:drug/metabolite transporter (DMT)-like permease